MGRLMDIARKFKTAPLAPAAAPESSARAVTLGYDKNDRSQVEAILGEAPEEVRCRYVLASAGRDPYAEKLQAAFQQVCQPDYPVGMVPWLGEVNPRLYAELTERLPNEMQTLWELRAPLEQFERVVDRWLETQRQGCALYRAHREAEQKRGGQTNRGMGLSGRTADSAGATKS